MTEGVSASATFSSIRKKAELTCQKQTGKVLFQNFRLCNLCTGRFGVYFGKEMHVHCRAQTKEAFNGLEHSICFHRENRYCFVLLRK